MLDKLGTTTTVTQEEEDGGILLSSPPVSMTRQLNILVNIVQRVLLFGGDDELLVLKDTLQDDFPLFQTRYSNESEDGTEYYQCLIALLETAGGSSKISTLKPPLPLRSNAYANAYERLAATCFELGSGYFVLDEETDESDFRLEPDDNTKTKLQSILQAAQTKSLPIPQSPVEELGRFAMWESNVRGALVDNTNTNNNNPPDLVGEWKIQEEVGGQVLFPNSYIRLKFQSDGTLQLVDVLKDDSPTTRLTTLLQGLSWKLDPGPTHLDTCTFQVLAGDTILLYRGFLDRGARLEARFSKRPLQISGKVQLQLRTRNNNNNNNNSNNPNSNSNTKNQDNTISNSSSSSNDNNLPINYQQSSMMNTNFVMTQIL